MLFRSSTYTRPAMRSAPLTASSFSLYMLLEGGGDLSFQYTPQGDMLLTGRYSLMSGEMKYQIPIIPLKTLISRMAVMWSGRGIS